MKKIFKHLILCAILVLVGTGNAWANLGHDTHFGKVTVAASGNGTVYIGTTNDATSGNTTETWNCGGNQSGDSKTYYLFATPAEHYYFEKWTGNNQSSTVTPWQITTPAATGSNSNPNNTTYTASFLPFPKFQFKVQAAVTSEGHGMVFASWEETASPSYASAPAAITKSDVWGDTWNAANKTVSVHFYAKADAQYNFVGWCENQDGSGLIAGSGVADYEYSLTSTDNTMPANPQKILYAKFESADKPVAPTYTLDGVTGTSTTIYVGETLHLSTNTWQPTPVFGTTPQSVLSWNATSETFTATQTGTVQVTFSQAATDDGKNHDGNPIKWAAGSETFTITVVKRPAPTVIFNNGSRYLEDNANPIVFKVDDEEISTGFTWTLTSSNTNIASNASSSALAITTQYKGGENYEVNYTLGFVSDMYEAPSTSLQEVVVCKQARHLPLTVNSEDIYQSMNPVVGNVQDNSTSAWRNDYIEWTSGNNIKFKNIEWKESTTNPLCIELSFDGTPGNLSFKYQAVDSYSSSSYPLRVEWATEAGSWVELTAQWNTSASNMKKEQTYSEDFPEGAKSARRIRISRSARWEPVEIRNLTITSRSYFSCTPDGVDVKLGLSNGDYISQNIQVSYMDRGVVTATLSGADASHFAVGFANQSATTQSLTIGSEADEQTKQIYVKYLGTITGDNMATELARTATLTIQDEQGVSKVYTISFTKPNYVTFAPAAEFGTYTVQYSDMDATKAVASNNWYRIIQGNSNDAATLTATPASSQYVFEAWYVDGVKQGRENPWNVTLNTPKTITAKFLDKSSLPAPVYKLNGLDSKEVTLKVRTAAEAEDAQTATISYISGVDLNYVNATISSSNGGNVTFDKATGVITANRAGDVTLTLTQSGCEIYKDDEQTFTIHVVKNNPQFAWADPLPRFVVGQTLPTSEIFSFTPAAAEQNWTLTSDNESMLPSIVAPATGLLLPKEVNGVTLTFHQDATEYWSEIANTSIKINVTKEPVVFNWKNPSLIAGNNYSWTDFVETNSEGAWNLVSDDESVIPTMRSIANTSVRVEAGTVTLSFTQGQDLGHDAVSIQTKTFTVYPSNGIATYLVNGTTYNDLQSAITASTAGGKKYNIIVASDGIVQPGNYTIPVGVTLVVPYESTGTKSLTTPTVLEYHSSATPSKTTIDAYRTLKLTDGVNINVKGVIAVAAAVRSTDADFNRNPSGFPIGDVGVLDMSTGGHIEVENQGALYAWGFVRGQGYLDGNNTQNVGTIRAQSGSTIKECYAVGDWNGGSYTYAAAVNDKSYRIYPFQSYFVQNIEVPLRMEYGALDLLYTNVYGGSNANPMKDIKFIGNASGYLFRINSSDGAVTKWYDPTTDHLVVELEGDSKLDDLIMNLKVGSGLISFSMDVQASKFDLPILSNMHLKLKDCQLTLSSPIALQAGSIVEIPEGSSLTVATNVFVYDKDQWGIYVQKKYFKSLPTIPTPKISRGDGSTNTLDDAKLIVNGTLTVASNGALYTTAGGADIMGEGGGQIIWNRTLPANGTVYGYTKGSGVKEGTSNTSSRLDPANIVTNTCAPATLHNDNDSYTASLSSETFKNIHGRWFKSADAVELADHTYKFTYIDGDNTAATTFCVYTSDKTGLKAGYKWVNVALDNDFCGGKTFLGEDGNYYYYDNASTDAVSKWVQLVKLNDALYSGSDNNLYTFTGCAWASVGEIGDDCMYTVDEVKMALVGTEFIALEKDEYDEVFVDASGNYYMLFDGCVWQHATKIQDTYKAYEVLGNPYIWMGEEWVEVAAEGAYFYTTDDQGIKHYYEFDNTTFAWVPVRYKVRITTPTGDKRDFLTFDDAIAYLSQYNDPTVTLLEDAVATKAQTFAPGSKSTTATIDLNGHTVTANIGAAEYLLNMNTSATLEITDNSDKENGEIRVYTSVAKRADVIRITKGAVKMTKGKLFIHNTSNSTSGNASVIYAAAGQSVTMNGGELEAISTRYAYGIYSASSAALASTSVVTVNGGTISGTAKDYAYGIYSYGTVNLNGGTLSATTTTVNGVAGANYAYGIYANASSNATASSCYYATVNMTGGVVNATAATSSAYGISANAGQTVAGANSYKAYTNKASAKLNITGGEINAKCLTSTTAYGVYAFSTENSNGSSAKHIIKDCKITASATGTAYGVIFSASLHDLSGIALTGDVEIENADIYAETTSANTAAAVYANATSNFMSRAKYNNGTTGVSAANKKLWFIDADNNDGDLTHEAIAVSGDGAKKTYKCYIGGEGAGAHITIKSGNFRAKSAYQYAYGAYAVRSLCLYDGTEGRGEITILGGTFTAETSGDQAYCLRNAGIMNIKGGTFNALAGTSNAYGVYAEAGLTTIDGGTFNIDATTTTAYGIMATGVKEDNTGWEHRGEVVINDGVFNAHALGTTTAAGVYATGTYVELNQTKYDARTDANKQYYYPVDENGVKLANATIANYYPYKYGVHTPSGKITVNGGTFNAKAFTTTAIGAYANMSSAVRTDMIGRQGVARGEIIIHGGEFNSETETSSTAEGIRSYGTVYVDGGTFNVKSKTTTAYGLYVMDGTTTIDGGTFNIAAGTNTAVGLRSHVYANTEYGYFEEGNAIINGGTFNVNTWGGNTAYGVYVTGAAAAFAATKSTAYTGAKPTGYAAAGRATINGGTFVMNPSTGVDAYGFVLEGNKANGDAIAYPKCEVTGGFFQMKGTGVYAANTSAVEDGEGNQNLSIKGGHFSTTNNLAVAKPKDYVRAPYAVINCIDPEYKATYPYEVGEPVEITFVTDNGVELWRGNQPKGKTAIYPLTNGTPERASDDAHSYEFSGWDKELAEVAEPTTYTANFNTVGKKFMITWVDDKGVEIDHKEYTADEMPVHADPVKEGYDFTGWTPAMYAVDKDQTYTAGFSITQYTIRWVDEDGTLIREDRVNHGATPTKPANPTKDGYSFQAWNPGVVKATEDVTYTATYLLNLVTLTKAGGSPVPYTTFAAALTEANKADGGTLTLLQDVKLAGSAQSFTTSTTLDLNGHSLRGAVNKLITVNGTGKTVTVKDLKGGGMIDNTFATNAQLTAVYVTKGTFVLESGTIRVENPTTSASASYYAAAVLVPASQSFVMNGGTLTSIANNDYAYGVYNLGTATINGGTINTQALSRSYGVRADNTTTIHDVTINANAIRTTYGVAVWSSVAGKTITINGGTFNGNATTTTGYAIDATAASTINVNGGKFKATTKPISNTGKATIKVAGGFYDKDTEIAGLASPKKVVALVSEPEKAEGYNYKIVDAAYQVTFKAEDGTVLQQANIEAGVQPVYVGEAQTKASTPKYAYDFDGWMDASDSHVYAEAELPVASKDVVYTAHFAQRAVEYPITFSNIDGLGTDYVQMAAFDEMPVYNGPTPYMSGAVSNYAYTFIGWDPELAVVAGPATYTPRYDLVISHNVSFVINNASATTPTTLTVAEGAAVECPADQLVDCQHIVGWYKDAGLNEEWNFASDKLGDSDITLYAKWDTKTYTITWLDEFGDEIDQTVVDCGVVPSHENLYKPSTAACSYDWKGWNKTLVAANADATYKSLGFTQVAKRYAITFVTGPGATVINPIELEVGADVTAPADPTRTGYTFAGWDKEIPATMPAENMTITASWTVNQYTITFDTDGGSEVASITDDFGAPITKPGDPTKTGYTFKEWTPAIPATMPAEDMMITALWAINNIVISSDADISDYPGDISGASVTIEAGATLTINKSARVNNVTVQPGAELIINNGTTLTTIHNLYLQYGNNDATAETVINGAITADSIYLDMVIDGTNWHAFSLPYACEIRNVLYDGRAAQYGTDFFIRSFDGASYANGGKGWQNEKELTTIVANRGYLIGIADEHADHTLRFPLNKMLSNENTQVNVAVTHHIGSASSAYHGWNLVGEPYLREYQTSAFHPGESTLLQITIPIHAGYDGYDQRLLSDVELRPFYAYYFQVAATGNLGYVASAPSMMAARAYGQSENDMRMVSLVLSNSQNEQDETTLIISDRYTAAYETGADLVKMLGDGYRSLTKPVLYTQNGNGRMAFTAIPYEAAEQLIPVGFYAAADGTYTLSLNDNRDMSGISGVYLYDAWMNTTTNLLTTEYRFTSERAANEDGRFYIYIRRAPQVTTDINDIVNELETGVRKLIYEDKLYIVIDGKVYDSTGKMVK